MSSMDPVGRLTRSGTTLALLVLLMLLPACDDGSRAARQAMREAASWAETIRLLTELRRTDAVTRTFERQVVDAAREQLDAAHRTLRQQSIPDGRAHAGAAAVDTLRSLVATLPDVRARDQAHRARVMASLERLARVAQDGADAMR